MDRKIIEIPNGRLEVVCDNNGKIVFAKKILGPNHSYSDIGITIVSGYGELTTIDDVSNFIHIRPTFPQGSIVDFQYFDGEPERPLTNSKIGSLSVLDKEGNLIEGENFRLGEWERKVLNGQVLDTALGFSMSAPKSVKELVGRNLVDVMAENVSHQEISDEQAMKR